MLVLKRRSGQSVRIGRAVVTILRIGAVTVRLGIDAPPDAEIVWQSEQSDSPPDTLTTTVDDRPPVMLARPELPSRWGCRTFENRTPPIPGWLAV